MKHLVLLPLLFVLAVPDVAAGGITVVTEQWPPYNYSENGEIKGVVTEVVRAVMERAGLDHDIQVYPWARAYNMAMKTENVMIYSILRLPERESHFEWISVPGLAVKMYLFKPRHRTDIQAESLEDVRGYMIGVTRDTSTHHFLRAKGFEEGRNLIPLSTEKQNILMTMPGVERNDLATGDKLSLARWMSISGVPSDYLEELLLLFQKDIYLAFGKKTSPEVVAKVRRAVASLAEDGTLQQILDKHYNVFQGARN